MKTFDLEKDYPEKWSVSFPEKSRCFEKTDSKVKRIKAVGNTLCLTDMRLWY